MKSKSKILFRLVAYTDAAGKFTSNAVRNGNEDNFYVDDDLTDDITNRVAQDEVIQLGRLGMLMVIADGMGGMNAGEIASQIAVDTVKALFTAELLVDTITATAQSRQKYLERAIKIADKNIKLDSKKDNSHAGMGSTIIMAWLFNDELSISWCGDSRAYIFNEKTGIRLVSQDHSYVQELVHKGILTYEQTFDHPQNNIITRSLGDPTKEAQPESKTIRVGKGDIILLCSDGLSGVLRDRKTYDSNGQLYPENNIEDIIRANTNSMKDCRRALWEAAEKGGWYDNVTAVLCQIIEGPESPWITTHATLDASNNKNTKKKWSILCVVIVAAIISAFFIGKYSNRPSSIENSIYPDSIQFDKMDSIEVKENVINNIQDSTTEISVRTNENEINAQEQVKKESEIKEDTTTLQTELTRIQKDNKDEKSKNKHLNIEDRLKNDSDNPLTPPNIHPNNPFNNK
jgi:serine/threonine protein phosphatase PrpC